MLLRAGGGPGAGAGPEEACRCTEIRRQAPGAGDPAAEGADAADRAVAHAVTRAEPAWRRALAAQNLDGIRQQAER
ncbi:hypothetical protein [Streptomyces virginiae]|uniref:hypothetical protein n=1 Tax=Streptomyces virginiae TaxID=1961 RepID=UPI003454B6A6